jgi:hypothetical protein
MRVAPALLAVIAGCTATAVQYEGPRRPRSQVARIGGDRARVKVIDGDPVDDSYIEILPGEHELEVAMDAALAGLGTVGAVVMRSTQDLTVCFRAYPGRFYVVKPTASIPYVHNHWRPAVFDRQAEVYVEHPCPSKNPVGVVSPAAPQPNQSGATTIKLEARPAGIDPE